MYFTGTRHFCALSDQAEGGSSCDRTEARRHRDRRRDQGRAPRAHRQAGASRASPPASAPCWSATTPARGWYVNGKHKDCAEVGIASIRVDLPEVADPGRDRGGRRRAQRRPRPAPATSSSCRCRAAATRTGCSGSSTPPRTPTACTRPTSAGWSSATRRRCRARRTASSSCCVATTWRSRAPRSSSSAAASRSAGRSGLLLTRRSENATVTLCHTGTVDLAAHVRKADIVVAAAGVPGIITGDMVKPGAAVLDVGVSRVDGKIAGDVADGRLGRRRLGVAQPRRRRADDPRHAARERRRDGREAGGALNDDHGHRTRRRSRSRSTAARTRRHYPSTIGGVALHPGAGRDGSRHRHHLARARLAARDPGRGRRARRRVGAAPGAAPARCRHARRTPAAGRRRPGRRHRRRALRPGREHPRPAGGSGRI